MISAETMFLGALMWARPAELHTILAHVDNHDCEDPSARTILAAIRRLAEAKRPTDSTGVADELQRNGHLGGHAGQLVSRRLLDAVTCGADGHGLRTYAAAVVSASYRRRYSALGRGLIEHADSWREDDLLPYLVAEGSELRLHSKRLIALRGDRA